MKNLILIFIVFTLATSSCKRYYQISNFDRITKSHKTIAILPFEVYTYGHTPKDLSPEMIDEIDEFESTAFQANFFNKVLRTTGHRKCQLSIGVQHYSETNELLKEEGINIKDAWTMSPKKLANTLGVDAVVKARIEKDQYFSDGLSAGIDITQAIISIFADRNPLYINDANKEVVSEYSLIGNDGVVLWSIGYRNEADWKLQAEQLVSNINRRSARHFPYLEKR